MINENFCSNKNIGGYFLPFLAQNLAIFAQKSGFGHFLRNCTSDLSKTWSETGDKWFESSNGSVVFEKVLVWPFWPFLGQKYITMCVDVLAIFCYLGYVYGLGMIFYLIGPLPRDLSIACFVFIIVFLSLLHQYNLNTVRASCVMEWNFRDITALKSSYTCRKCTYI